MVEALLQIHHSHHQIIHFQYLMILILQLSHLHLRHLQLILMTILLPNNYRPLSINIPLKFPILHSKNQVLSYLLK